MQCPRPNCGGMIQETQDAWGYSYRRCSLCGRDPGAMPPQRPTSLEMRGNHDGPGGGHPKFVGREANFGVQQHRRPKLGRDPRAIAHEMAAIHREAHPIPVEALGGGEGGTLRRR